MTRKIIVSFLFTVGSLMFGSVLGADSTPRHHASAISVYGSVLNEAGEPLAGARVDLLPVLTGFELLRGQLERRLDAQPVATARSGSDGRYHLEAPNVGLWRLFVKAEGHLGLRAFLVPLTHELELDPATMLRDVGASLRVVDTTGQGVAGAGVWIGSSNRDLWQRVSTGVWRAAPRVGWTDAEGHLTIPRLAGEALKIEAWSPAGDAVAQTRMADTATVTLPAAGPRRALEVRDAEGLPMAGVLVTVGARTWPLGLTGDDGHWSVPAIGNETAIVVFHPDGRHQLARLPGEGADPTVLALPPGVRVTGRVVGADGHGLGGALVWAAHHAPGFALSDADGNFTLLPPSRKEIRLEARASGYLATSRDTTGETSVSLVLERAAGLRGRVVTADGQPLPGTRLEARIVASGFQAPETLESSASADEYGHFQLADLKRGVVYRLSADRDGYATHEIEVEATLPTANDEGLRLVLHSGRAAFGTVRDLDELPLSGVEVRLQPAGQTVVASATGSEDDPFVATTDAKGRFETRDVPAQQLDIVARGRGLAPLTVRGLGLPPGRLPVDLGTLYLEPAARLEGRVLDPDGEPLANAQIWSAPSSERSLGVPLTLTSQPTAVSDAAGRFTVGELAPGQNVDLEVDRDGFLPTALSGLAVPSAQPVIAELQRAATLAGQVVDADGQGIEGATIGARYDDPAVDALLLASPTVTTDDAGRFELADVAPGHLDVDALAEGFQPSAKQHFDLVAGQKLEEALFVLERGAVLEGWVSDNEGEPVADARVLVGRHSAATDADGAYTVAGIPPGSQHVEVRHEAYNPLERTVELELGSQRADFELTGGATVAGRVVDESGLPLEGVVLELEGHLEPSLQPRLYTDESAGSGDFRWAGVANGRYSLVARKKGYVTTRLDTEIEIDGSSAEDLEVRLGSGATIFGRVLGLSFEELTGVQVQAKRGRQQLMGTVDYEGLYRVLDAEPGDWLVVARLPGGGRQTQSRITLDDGVGDVERDLEFGAGVTLTGSVLHGDEVLAGAAVTLAGADVAVERAVTTDVEGRFKVADLPAGSYRLGVGKTSLRLVHNQNLVIDADRDVVVEIATARIVGEVRVATSGEPLADAMVMLKQVLDAHGSQGSLFTVASGTEGQFTLERLTSGRYQVTVQRDGYQPLMRDLDVPSSGAVELPLDLEPTPGLEVMARLASGRSPRLLTLVALDGGGQPALRASRVLDPEGFIRFASFPEGTWDLLVSAPDSALLRTTVSVPGEPLAAVLLDAGPLHVRVADLVESDAIATLSIIGADQRPFLRLDTSGQLERSWQVVGGWATVSGLPAGAWTVSAQADDGRAWSGSVVTTGGPGVEIELGQ